MNAPLKNPIPTSMPSQKTVLEKIMGRMNLGLVISGLLVGIVVYLLGSMFLAQLQLRRDALAQIAIKSQEAASAARHFFTERRADLENAAQQSEIRSYLDSQALGMTIEYGLGASMIAVDEYFKKFLESHSLNSKVGPPHRTYVRLFFLIKDSKVINDINLEPELKIPLTYATTLLNDQVTESRVVVFSSKGRPHVLITAPVVYKGAYHGTIFAAMADDAIYDGLLDHTEYVLADGNGILREPDCKACQLDYYGDADVAAFRQRTTGSAQVRFGSKATGKDLIATRILISGTPFELLYFVPESVVFGVVSPYTLVGVITLLLGALATGAYVNMRERRKLHRIIVQKNATLAEEDRLKKAMLESLGQGFMLIDPQGLCLPIYSSACERLFLKSPAGQNIWDILQLNEKQLSNMQSWLRTIFTEALNFQSLLPLALKQVELGGRTIGLEYHEMRGADDRIEMLMIVATDNTLLIKAEKKAADQKAEAQAILTLVSDPKRYFESITLTENAITLLQQVNFDKVTVKRALHNLKGIAGFGHLLALQSLAHEIEDKIDLPDFSAKVAIEQLLTILNVYREKYSALLPETAEDANAVKVSSSTARAFAQILAHLDIPVQVRREFVDKFILIPAAKMIQRLNGVLRDTATMLGKEAHNIEITGGGFASRP